MTPSSRRSLPRKQAWGSKEMKGWAGVPLTPLHPHDVPGGWDQSPGKGGRRWTLACPRPLAAPGLRQEQIDSLTFPSSRSCAQVLQESLLPPIAETRSRPKPAMPHGGPTAQCSPSRRHSFPCPGNAGPPAVGKAAASPGKENLPLLHSPEKGRNAGARSQRESALRKTRRNSDGKERTQPGSKAFKPKGAGNVPERLLRVGRKMRAETVESDSTSEDCEDDISAEEEEYMNERIIEWLIGVNECLYRESGLGPWPTLSDFEQDTSIKIVHEGD